MAKLVFYIQKRFDGGSRTGIELDDETIAHHFEDVQGEHNPKLRWFVDLRCNGPGVSDDPETAIAWLLGQSEVIRDGFARFAEELAVGADPDVFSLRWTAFDGLPEGVEMAIVCSATRRTDARELSGIVADFGNRWNEILLRDLELGQEAGDVR